MSSASSIRAGEAYIVISAKLDELHRELQKGNQQIQSFGKSFGAIAGGAGVAVAAFEGLKVAINTTVQLVSNAVHTFADVGSQLNDMASRTGIGTDRLQALGYAAKLTGSSLEDIEQAVKQMARQGIPIGQFEQFGKAIAAIEDPTDRAQAALNAFGKSGLKLIPLFREWNALKAANAAVGPTLTEDDVRRADALGDAFTGLSEAWSRLNQQAGSGLADSLQVVLETLIGATAQLGEFIKQYKGLLTTVAYQGTAQAGALAQGAASILPGGSLAAGALTSGGALAAQHALSSAYQRGHVASGGGAGAGVGALAGEDAAMFVSKRMEEEQKAIAKRMAEINKAFVTRNSLAREFLNESERAAEKEAEIKRAIVDANAAFRAGGVSIGARNEQVRGLAEALRRLHIQEAERLAKERPGLAKAREEAAAGIDKIQRSSSGTFSGAGASLLGRGADPILREAKESNVELRRIRKAVESPKPSAVFS